MLSEGSCTERLEEVATIVPEDTGLEDQDSFDSGGDYIHDLAISIKRMGL